MNTKSVLILQVSLNANDILGPLPGHKCSYTPPGMINNVYSKLTFCITASVMVQGSRDLVNQTESSLAVAPW